jgi:hypothetical protein
LKTRSNAARRRAKSRSVLGDRIEVEDAAASARPDGSEAAVGSLERLRVGAQGSHDLGGHVVSAIHAPGVSTREKEERGRRVDDDVPYVSRAGRAALLFDFEAQAEEVGRLGAKSWRVDFALTSLGEAQRRWAVFSKVHDRSPQGISTA